MMKCLQEERSNIISSHHHHQNDFIDIVPPRSPLSKAFDFLPWSKFKKPQPQPTSTLSSSSITTAATITAATATTTSDKKNIDSQKQKSSSAVLRNSKIILLSDKFIKNKNLQNKNDILCKYNTVQNRKIGKKITRNKSLDIEEILKKNCDDDRSILFENNNNNNNNNDNGISENVENFNRKTFLDDTFIENYIKYGDADGIRQHEFDEKQQQHQSNQQLEDYNENVPIKNMNTNQKHILFNDENVIYLIRKENPVIRSSNDNNCGSGNGIGGCSRDDKGRGTSLKKKTEDCINNNNNNTSTNNTVSKSKSKIKQLTKSSQDDSILGNNKKLSISYSRQKSSDLLLTNCSTGGSGGGGSGGNYWTPKTVLENFVCEENNTENTEIGRKQKFSIIGGGSGSSKLQKRLSFREPVAYSCQQIQKNIGQNQGNNNINSCRSNSNTNISSVNDCGGNNDKKIWSNINLEEIDRQRTDSPAILYDLNLESQAMRIVRTVGQAFEVCHKYGNQRNFPENNDERSDISSSDILDQDKISDQLSDDELLKKEHPFVSLGSNNALQRPNHLEILPSQMNESNINKKSSGNDNDKPSESLMSSNKEIQKLKEQLEQQTLQTRQALAQLMLVREQLISETKARIEAQARTQQLLQQNRELLEHLASLGGYTEPNQSGLTSANISLAPQSQLQMLLQQQQQQQQHQTATSDLSSSLRKTFLPSTSTTNNNSTSITQQLNNLGSINQQLTSLSHQLSGLNQQSLNLQSFQNFQTGTPLQQQQQQQHQPSNNYQTVSNAFPNLNQIECISKKLSNLAQTTTAHQTAPDAFATQNDLFQMNQELLNRLQALNLSLNTGGQTSQSNINSVNGQNYQDQNQNHNRNSSISSQNSFFFSNPGHFSNSLNNTASNNGSFNFLSSPSSLGNLTPSPIGTINRKSYSNSPMDETLTISIEKNLNNTDETAQFIKPLSQVGTLTTLDSDGKTKIIVPVSNGDRYETCIGGDNNGCAITKSNNSNFYSSRRDVGGSDGGCGGGVSPNHNRNEHNNSHNLTVPNSQVTLKVTDESGNSRKLSATPSFITRSTSEKVPNRSQMMSQVQRTAWARHTTK